MTSLPILLRVYYSSKMESKEHPKGHGTFLPAFIYWTDYEKSLMQ